MTTITPELVEIIVRELWCFNLMLCFRMFHICPSSSLGSALDRIHLSRFLRGIPIRVRYTDPCPLPFARALEDTNERVRCHERPRSFGTTHVELADVGTDPRCSRLRVVKAEKSKSNCICAISTVSLYRWKWP